MKRRGISLILTLALCMVFAVPAFAADARMLSNITIDVPGVQGLTCTMTGVYDYYRSVTGEYSSTPYKYDFVFSPAGTVTFNQDVFFITVWKFDADDVETLKAGNAFTISEAKGAVDFGLSGRATMQIKDGKSLSAPNSNFFYISDDLSDLGIISLGFSADEYSISSLTSLSSTELKESGYASISDLAATTTPAPALTAKPTASTVLVNGKQVAFDAYNINGNNYFKLRDLAYALNGSAKQFDVGWDGLNNAISLTSGKAYTVVGGEMTGKGAGDKTPTPTSSKIYLDGKEVTFTAYNIDGNNYFKLRDIGEAFDFGVTWDGAKNTIVIDTSKGYTPE